MTDSPATQPQRGRRRIIERPRLTRLLDESPARLKLLVAPAGYGKTTLARQWTANVPRAWFRVSASAADLVSVARGVATAASDVVSECNLRLDERLRITKSPDAEWPTLAEILIEDLAGWPENAWLVFDDAQNALDKRTTSAFVSTLVRESAVNALLCTRQRPPWVTARDLLYGQALEIGRNSLAMTHEEAGEVMQDTPATLGVVALADGWPAVVGLASLTPEQTLMSGMTAGLPEALYDYLAEELYQALPPDIQDAMRLIAVAGVRSRELVMRLFPARDREKALRDVIDAGWLTTDSDGNFELHPLLEAFLRDKLDQEPGPETRAKAKRVGAILVAESHWDEAFTVIQRYGIDEQLPPLFRTSLEELLATGRTATLRDWLAYAERKELACPERDLASAELLFREGRFHESEMLALAAADGLSQDDVWRSRALSTAGRAAHAANREQEAFDYYRTAREVALSDTDVQSAALGELAAAIDLELPQAPSLFAQLPAHSDSVAGLVAHVSRAMTLSSRFETPPDFNEARRVYRLLPLVRDPLERCSFRNIYGYAMASAGEIEEARTVIASQLDDAQRYRLDFVVPYADLIAAIVELVSARFDRVDDLLHRAETAGKRAGDDLLTVSAAAVRTRSLVARGQFKDAVEASMPPTGNITPSTYGELLASRALALACNRDDERALATAQTASEVTGGVEARVCVAATHAIVVGNRAEPDVFTLARVALRSALVHKCAECFITAYRGWPQLTHVLLASDETREDVLRILAISDDLDTFTQEASSVGGTWESLTPREREVLAHVADGLPNREIGKKLFIAEGTVKVHLGHAFEKLGVTSRTAAALRVPTMPGLRSIQLANLQSRTVHDVEVFALTHSIGLM